MKYKAYKISFKSPLHIGVEGIGAENIETYIPSDTLWGAIINTWFQLYEIEDKDAFCEKPPFRISSAFPFKKDGLFFPLPIGSLDYLFGEVDVSMIKKIKKIRYAEKEVYEKLIRGEKIPFSKLSVSQEKIEGPFLFILNNRFKNVLPVYKVVELPRVTIDRGKSSAIDGDFFYFSQMYFTKGCGLFFLAEFDEVKVERQFDASLSLLADEGLGADRNVGKGFFSYQKSECELCCPENTDFFTTLSLYHPREAEIKAGLIDKAAYTINNRKGFAFHNSLRGKRKKSIRMFGEGSWFKQVDGNNTLGSNEILIDRNEGFIPFNLYRYGKAFSIPYKGFDDEQ